MTFGSLFSGIGGFDLGFERAGMECAWQCEIEPHLRALLSGKFNVPVFDDVRNVTKENAKRVDVICGGFPCQDVSVAGRRVGLAGERSGLWFEFYRVLQELRPRYVVIENVPGLLSSNKGRDFATVLQGLEELGYQWAYRILDAQFFGVPQRRRRVFVVASLGDSSCAKILFESESRVRDNPPSREEGESVAATLSRGSAVSGNAPGRRREDDVNLVAYNKSSFAAWKEGVGTLRSNGGDLGGGSETIIAHALTTHAAKGGDPTTDNYVVMDISHRRDGVRLYEDVAPTLSTFMGTGGNNVPIVGVRRLTPSECARLQGFPPDWCDGFSDSKQYRAYGNAVCVPVARWIGERIFAQLKAKGVKK